MTPAQLIEAVRRRHGLTQVELARRAGTSQPVVSAYEHARRDPTFRHTEQAGRGGRRAADHRRQSVRARRASGGHSRRSTPAASPTCCPSPTPSRRAGEVGYCVRRASSRRDRRCRWRSGSWRSTVRWQRSRTPSGERWRSPTTPNPAATIDIDLNLFVPVERYPDVAAPLVELGAAADDPDGRRAGADAMARLECSGTPRPIDLFFAYDAFHHAAAASRRRRPLRRHHDPDPRGRAPASCARSCSTGRRTGSTSTPWSPPTPPIDVPEVLRWVGRIAGDEDPRYERITAVLTRR